MTSTPSAVLGFELQGQNDNPGAWWANANQVFQVVEDALAKELIVSTTGGTTNLTITPYAPDQSRVAIIRIAVGQTLISLAQVNAQRARIFFVTNESTAGAFAVQFGGGSGAGQFVTIPRGAGAYVRVRTDLTTTFAGPLIDLSLGTINGGSLASGAFLLGANNLSDLADKPTGRVNLGVIGFTAKGDANVTLAAGDLPLVANNVTLTAPRVYQLPLANSVKPGQPVTIVGAGINGVNTLTVSRQSADTIVGLGATGTTALLDTANQVFRANSDGVSSWVVSFVGPLTRNDNPDLVSIHALGAGGTTGVLKKTAANTYALDNGTTALIFEKDFNGNVLATGVLGEMQVPFACTITGVTLLADQSGSCVVDIWKAAYASYPPTVANTIVASAPPTISAAQKATDSTLTGWTTAIAAGDTLRFNLNSVSSLTRVTVILQVKRY
jgi:hypothetical protein